MTIEKLKDMAATIRCGIISSIAKANAGHAGGSLSAADLVTALYFRMMRVDPERPDWPERDRFILSKGHACPVWYAALAERGYFDRSHLDTLRQPDSILQGHADMTKTPGMDMTVGSLGQEFSVGIRMALSGKLRKRDHHVWVIVGDGESQEGAIWEAAMSGARLEEARNTGTTIDISNVLRSGREARRLDIKRVEATRINGAEAEQDWSVMHGPQPTGPRETSSHL